MTTLPRNAWAQIKDMTYGDLLGSRWRPRDRRRQHAQVVIHDVIDMGGADYIHVGRPRLLQLRTLLTRYELAKAK